MKQNMEYTNMEVHLLLCIGRDINKIKIINIIIIKNIIIFRTESYIPNGFGMNNNINLLHIIYNSLELDEHLER